MISSSIPGVSLNATYSKELQIEAPSSKLIQLGAATGVIAAVFLLVML